MLSCEISGAGKLSPSGSGIRNTQSTKLKHYRSGSSIMLIQWTMTKMKDLQICLNGTRPWPLMRMQIWWEELGQQNSTKCSWKIYQYKKLFLNKKPEMLAPRGTFHYAIQVQVKKGATSTWEPIYLISLFQLEELNKYLYKRLVEGKIVYSLSRPGLPSFLSSNQMVHYDCV